MTVRFSILVHTNFIRSVIWFQFWPHLQRGGTPAMHSTYTMPYVVQSPFGVNHINVLATHCVILSELTPLRELLLCGWHRAYRFFFVLQSIVPLLALFAYSIQNNSRLMRPSATDLSFIYYFVACLFHHSATRLHVFFSLLCNEITSAVREEYKWCRTKKMNRLFSFWIEQKLCLP